MRKHLPRRYVGSRRVVRRGVRGDRRRRRVRPVRTGPRGGRAGAYRRPRRIAGPPPPPLRHASVPRRPYFFAHLGIFEPNTDSTALRRAYDSGGTARASAGTSASAPRVADRSPSTARSAVFAAERGPTRRSAVPLTIGGRFIIPHPFFEPYVGAGLGVYFASLDENRSPSPRTVSPGHRRHQTPTSAATSPSVIDFWLNPRMALNFEGRYHWVEPTFTTTLGAIFDVNMSGWTAQPRRSGSPSEQEAACKAAPGPPPRRIRGIRPAGGHAGGEALLPARPDAVRPVQPRPPLREGRFPLPLPLPARRDGVREDRAVRELPRQHLRREVPGGDTDRRLDGARRHRPEVPARRPGPSRRSPRLHPEPPVDLLRGEGDRLPPPVPGVL